MSNGVHTGCVCVIAALFLVPVVSGDIVEVPSSDYDILWGDHVQPNPGSTTSTVSAESDGDDPDNCGGAWGETQFYTTEAGTFDWAYNLYGEVYCELMLWDNETSYSHAWADISASAPDGGASFSAHVGLTQAGYQQFPWDWGQTWQMNGYYVQGSDEFSAMAGVSSENMAVVYISVHEGGADCGYAIGEARAQCWLWEPL